MSKAEARKYAKWLEAIQHNQFRDVAPIRVQIEKFEFFGVFYTIETPYRANENMVLDGIVNAGEISWQHRISLIGLRPKVMKNSRRVYVWNHSRSVDERVQRSIGEWYVAGYYEGFGLPENKQFDQYHFSNTFDLSEACVYVVGPYEGLKIDAFDRAKKPRQRIPMSVEFIR
jgi:hypothetical protein